MSEEKKPSREYVEKHRQVKEKVEEIISKCACACVPVRKLSEELKMDDRTVKAHLEILEMHKIGTYLDPDKKVFCTANGIKKIADKLDLKIKEKENAEHQP
ncbi:hypothetical protein KAU55_01540 [Candidatus Bathyarchaeota archaeon]|nr:hypothetical protein [Candidatus Bathyarchaeota archaeon]